jgi:hypothetical protein
MKKIAVRVQNALSFSSSPFSTNAGGTGLAFTDPDAWFISNLPSQQGIDFLAKHIPDTRDLIAKSADPTVVNETNGIYQRRKGVLTPVSNSGLQGVSIAQKIHLEFLASQQFNYNVLTAFSSGLQGVLKNASAGLKSGGDIYSLGAALKAAFANAVESASGAEENPQPVSFIVQGINGPKSESAFLGRQFGVMSYPLFVHELSRKYNDAKKVGTDTFYNGWNRLFIDNALSKFADPGVDRTAAQTYLKFAVATINSMANEYKNLILTDTTYKDFEKQIKKWQTGAANSVATSQ